MHVGDVLICNDYIGMIINETPSSYICIPDNITINKSSGATEVVNAYATAVMTYKRLLQHVGT